MKDHSKQGAAAAPVNGSTPPPVTEALGCPLLYEGPADEPGLYAPPPVNGSGFCDVSTGLFRPVFFTTKSTIWSR